MMNLRPPPRDRPAEYASRYVAPPPGPLLPVGEPYLHVAPFTVAHPTTLMVITVGGRRRLVPGDVRGVGIGQR
jgi:hypothetical protein